MFTCILIKHLIWPRSWYALTQVVMGISHPYSNHMSCHGGRRRFPIRERKNIHRNCRRWSLYEKRSDLFVLKWRDRDEYEAGKCNFCNHVFKFTSLVSVWETDLWGRIPSMVWTTVNQISITANHVEGCKALWFPKHFIPNTKNIFK